MNNGSKKTLTKLIITVPLMFAFGFALVPLYDVFCEVTGLNGKVFQSEYSENLVIEDGDQYLFNLFQQIMRICHGPFNLLKRS